MAELSYPSSPAGLAGAVLSAAPPLPYMGARAVALASGPGRDWRFVLPNTGVIRDQVMFKATPSSSEAPFAGGRVRLHRLLDGYCAWQGLSDASGHYTATCLEVGVEYIAVGIDVRRNFKATGAGPVIAVEAA